MKPVLLQVAAAVLLLVGLAFFVVMVRYLDDGRFVAALLAIAAAFASMRSATDLLRTVAWMERSKG